jgi:hypothetical protein
MTPNIRSLTREKRESPMKRHLLPATTMAAVLILVLFAPRVAFSQRSATLSVPKSGALLTINGTVGGSVVVNRNIYDSQIHSGTVRAVPQAPNLDGGNCNSVDVTFQTDAYILQGGSWTGCDPGDTFETTQGTGTATLAGAGYSFGITTFYTFGGDPPQCNTNGNICVPPNPDSGFLTVTNNSGADFSGTITLSGTSPISGGFCPANGSASDVLSSGLPNGAFATFALSNDSSNCGGFNAPQTASLTAGGSAVFPMGNDNYQIAAVNNVGGELETFLPVPVPQALFVPGTLFTGQSCSPYNSFSSASNPVCLEGQLSCSGSDCGTFLYQVSTHFDNTPFPLGFPSFLKADGVGCPANGFNENILLSYTDPLPKGGTGGHSCLAAAFGNGTTEPATFTAPFYASKFFDPIDSPPVFNTAQAGSAIPTIFQLLAPNNTFVTPTANGGLTYCTAANTSTCAPGTVFIKWVQMTCPNASSMITDAIETTASTTGNSGLQFNTQNNTWQYNVKTPKGNPPGGFAGTCQVLDVVFPLGLDSVTSQPLPPITRSAFFQFKK